VTPSFSCFWAWSWSMTSTSGTPASSFGHSSCASSSDFWVYHHHLVSMTDQFEHLKLISFCVTLPDSINVPPLLPCFLFSFRGFYLDCHCQSIPSQASQLAGAIYHGLRRIARSCQLLVGWDAFA
jgi:hypothetical protein